MSTQVQKLEKRVARLEKELRSLKSRLSPANDKPWWERIAGRFEGDPAFAEIVRLGRRIRRTDGKGIPR